MMLDVMGSSCILHFEDTIEAYSCMSGTDLGKQDVNFHGALMRAC